jgi:Cu-Zn family superoxide dismutase
MCDDGGNFLWMFRAINTEATKPGETAMERKSVLAGLLLAAGLAFATPAVAADTAHAVLEDKDGKEVGKVDFTDTPSGVLMRLDLTAVPPGEHALHLHTAGKCEPPDFKSAGGHFNPDDTKHGLMSDEGPHAGDLPDIYVPESGKITIEVLAPLVTLNGERALLDADGTAIVIHEGADDALTDPAGNSGKRIACGVITK